MKDEGESVPVEPQTAHSIDLVRRAQAGEDEAMNGLIQRYYERVRPIVRARIGPALRRRVDDSDILQDTFLEAIQLFDRFEVHNEASLIRWLSRIAEHRVQAAVQKTRTQKRDPRREAHSSSRSSTGDRFGKIAAAGPSPSSNVARREEEERLIENLDQLKEEHREVILQRDFYGTSWEDIAIQMGRPTAAAARMLHTRAEVELAAIYRRQEEG